MRTNPSSAPALLPAGTSEHLPYCDIQIEKLRHKGGPSTLHNDQGRQQHHLCHGSVCPTPAGESGTSEARSRHSGGGGRGRGRREGTAPASSRALVHPPTPEGTNAAASPFLRRRPASLQVWEEGTLHQLRSTTFTCHLPDVDTCGGGGRGLSVL